MNKINVGLLLDKLQKEINDAEKSHNSCPTIDIDLLKECLNIILIFGFKPKNKCNVEQVPGQLDLFDIIDNKTE